ncbi:CheC, inhibitor of MCP methylation / FliN fusion protein [Caldalkalibacillus thermarum TA2.A1]|uniref:CheC, inhibitor of MCP methylation / FliN fusion protein n=1 Tax=Caldalkalibacillus thermarum (strain TA2.A1) TaxID=986075 RepID=F5L806_CALTT|nr:flagellar motor switch phosphatase FliY [Caldalkalibacillus thermarum]EGL82514.1 CheC, inhibitor of MCP methylation / FliN fusion protein [Caldalkalibacillus thermarum TA2.A1]QZT33012.1 flagellar motor switch phosphatase FliY [Caldalkalibacillus thermarum TA2.A1]
MASDMLSQEEIDALLKQQKKDGKEQGDVDQYLSTFEQDAIGEIGNIAFGSASTVLSALLNQKVDITTPKLSLLHTDRLAEEFPKPHVAVYVNYTEGFKGLNLLIIKIEDASVIADLMLGGDGKNPEQELNEIHTSAVQEAMNQMMGSAATALSTMFDRRIDISPPGIDIFDVTNTEFEHPLLEEKVLLKVAFKLRVGELINSEIMQLIPISFAKEMVGLLLNPEESSQPENQSASELSQQEPPQRQSTVDPEREGASRGDEGVVDKQSMTDFGPKNDRYQGSPVQPVEFAEFDQKQPATSPPKNLDLLMDIPLQVTVELGRTKRTIKEILELSPGSILELDKLAGEPVDILINNKPIAKGEVVVIEENFGVRVTDILSQRDRLQTL